MNQKIEENGSKRNKKQMSMHHTINGVATDLLVHIDDLVEKPEDIEYWADHLVIKTGIEKEEAVNLIRHHLGYPKQKSNLQ